jgi:hypothetical protein
LSCHPSDNICFLVRNTSPKALGLLASGSF